MFMTLTHKIKKLTASHFLCNKLWQQHLSGHLYSGREWGLMAAGGEEVKRSVPSGSPEVWDEIIGSRRRLSSWLCLNSLAASFGGSSKAEPEMRGSDPRRLFVIGVSSSSLNNRAEVGWDSFNVLGHVGPGWIHPLEPSFLWHERTHLKDSSNMDSLVPALGRNGDPLEDAAPELRPLWRGTVWWTHQVWMVLFWLLLFAQVSQDMSKKSRQCNMNTQSFQLWYTEQDSECFCHVSCWCCRRSEQVYPCQCFPCTRYILRGVVMFARLQKFLGSPGSEPCLFVGEPLVMARCFSSRHCHLLRMFAAAGAEAACLSVLWLQGAALPSRWQWETVCCPVWGQRGRAGCCDPTSATRSSQAYMCTAVCSPGCSPRTFLWMMQHVEIESSRIQARAGSSTFQGNCSEYCMKSVQHTPDTSSVLQRPLQADHLFPISPVRCILKNAAFICSFVSLVSRMNTWPPLPQM